MGYINGSNSFPGYFNIGADRPIDTRMVVDSVSDLTGNWTTSANKKLKPYKGMIVSVLDDGNLYQLTGDTHNDRASWKLVGKVSNADEIILGKEITGNTENSTYASGDTVKNVLQAISDRVNAAVSSSVTGVSGDSAAIIATKSDGTVTVGLKLDDSDDNILTATTSGLSAYITGESGVTASTSAGRTTIKLDVDTTSDGSLLSFSSNTLCAFMYYEGDDSESETTT